ncbi:MAG: four helix bundle protein [Patescibacteria group bacterium]
MTEQGAFHSILRKKIDLFVHAVYAVSRTFPREELYGVTSQFRRAALSVALNYIEGYARTKRLVHVQFLETSYGSLKEAGYLIEFCSKENIISSENCTALTEQADEIGKMLWGTIQGLKQRA